MTKNDVFWAYFWTPFLEGLPNPKTGLGRYFRRGLAQNPVRKWQKMTKKIAKNHQKWSFLTIFGPLWARHLRGSSKKGTRELDFWGNSLQDPSANPKFRELPPVEKPRKNTKFWLFFDPVDLRKAGNQNPLG